MLYDLLSRMTDEEHALNSGEIIAELAKRNIAVSHKVLPQDIALLNEYGYEVSPYKKKHHYYYVINCPFDTSEIAMLAAVVKASKLNSTQKTGLIAKLAETVGRYKSENFSKYIINCDAPKHSNRHIIYSIDSIDRA